MKERRLLIAALCLLLTACVTTSVNPLSSPNSARPDPALIGSWHEKGATDEVLEFSAKNAHWMHLEDRKKDKPPETYDFFVTDIDGFHFLNVLHKASDDWGFHLPEGYVIVRYEINGRHVRMWYIDEDKVAAAIRAGRLKGTIPPEYNATKRGQVFRPDVDVILKDSGPNLIKFIREFGPKKLFSDQGSDLYRLDKK